MIRQRTRLVAAMVRPLIWLLVIGGGFNSVVGRAHGLNYQDFLVPGVLGMTTLFGAMLAALTTVYDKESGVMRMMIVAPLPHAWIVLAKMVSAALAAIVQALLLIVLLVLLGHFGNGTNWALLAAAVAAASFACAGIGMDGIVFPHPGQLRSQHELRHLPGLFPERVALPSREFAGRPETRRDYQSIHVWCRFSQARHPAGVRTYGLQ